MKRIKLFLSALVLSLSSVLAFVAPAALAAPITWDGGGGDNNMTTATNWSGDVAPVAGDDLIFPANITKLTVTNDFTAGTSFNSITFSGATTQDSNYTVSGNSMTVVGGITNSMTGSSLKYQTLSLPLVLNGNQTFADASSATLIFSGALGLGTSNLTVNSTTSVSISGVMSGSGTVTKSGAGILSLSGASTTYSGAITINAGKLYVGDSDALGSSAAGTTVNAGADLGFYPCASATLAEPLTLSGASSSAADNAKLTVGGGCGGGGGGETYGVSATAEAMTFSGDITLGSDITFAPVAGTTTLTGGLSGAFDITLFGGYGGKLVVNSSPNTSSVTSGNHESPTSEKSVAAGDDQASTTVLVQGKTTLTLDGTRGDTTIASGATLKGAGTVGALSVNSGGTLAPGHSPGCINTGNLTFVSGATYEFEIGGTTACTGYDQTVVTGTVDLGSGTLSTVLYNSYKPKAGEKYVIISNDSSDAVTGTFTGLAQGATFTVSGYTLSVSYTGGDGNDVELTVTAVPPDTGFGVLTSSPYVTMAVMLGAAGAIALMARKHFRLAFASRRRR